MAHTTDPIPPEGLATAPSFFAVHADAQRLAALVRAVADGEIALPIDRTLPFARAYEEHRLVEAGGLGGKVILTPRA